MIDHRLEPGRHLEPAPPPLAPTGERWRPGRREVLKLGAAAGLVSLLGTGCAPAFGGIRAIGQAWLNGHPEEGSVAALVALLPAAVDPGARPGANLRATRAEVAADFAAGRVDWVEGWLLSETEARVAALWALS